jgi:diguanylate cyclase (GGDEF)-like protein
VKGILLAAITAMVGAVAGWVLARSLPVEDPRLAETEERRQRERDESNRIMARLRRDLEEQESLGREQAEVFVILPDLVRQMFAAKGRRGVPPLALKLVDQLFHPAQSAFFILGRPRELTVLDEDFLTKPSQNRLLLTVGKGLPQSLGRGFELEVGIGRIGYVAEHDVAMEESDFRALSGVAKRQVEVQPIEGLKAEVVAPIADADELMGVICMGGPKARLAHQKRLLKMVADLAAVALTHVSRLHATEEAANIDGLTGVLNKRAFQKRLGDEILRCEREHIPLSLLILDIDHFKTYNDTNGHLAGDEVLKKVGNLLKSSIREDDVAARYGGEEFIILYPGAAKALALRLAEALRRTVEGHPFAHREKQPLTFVSISGGVATFPEDAQRGVDLIRSADQALYEAKAAGRNRIIAAEPNYLT